MTPRNKRNFTCSWKDCDKAFRRKSDLCRHYRTHTNDRPYRCGAHGCSRAFIQRSALTVHSRTHTGEKPHKCTDLECGKAFSDSSSLARHRRIHANKRLHAGPELKDYRRQQSSRCELPVTTQQYGLPSPPVLVSNEAGGYWQNLPPLYLFGYQTDCVSQYSSYLLPATLIYAWNTDQGPPQVIPNMVQIPPYNFTQNVLCASIVETQYHQLLFPFPSQVQTLCDERSMARVLESPQVCEESITPSNAVT